MAGPAQARWQRRLTTTPVVLLGVPLVLVLSPVLIVAAAVADLLLGPRRLRFLRLVAMALSYLVYEWLGVVAAGALWVVTGFGLLIHRPWSRRLHHRVQRWWTASIFGAAERWLGARFEIHGGEHLAEGPVIVAARHASFLDAVVPSVVLGRHSDLLVRHVLKRELAWVPTLDIYGHRHPNHFVARGGSDRHSELEAIENLASSAPEEALVIFPEGTFRSAARAHRVLARFAAREPERAARLDLRHTLPPRPGGIESLMRGRPDADLAFIAHTGFEPFGSFRTIMANVPFGAPVRIHIWRVSVAELGSDPGARMHHIDDWWQRMDNWIGKEADKTEETTP